MKNKPSIILMVRPVAFGYNRETAITNLFQINDTTLSAQEIHSKALKEFDDFADFLELNGVEVNIKQDTLIPHTPDSIFPNNIFSRHDDIVVFYSMMAKNRRHERVKFNKITYGDKIKKYVYIENFVNDNLFLEGTGSIVFDYEFKIAYASISPRTNLKLLNILCGELNYKPVSFNSLDREGIEIYHTNVMMSIGKGFAVICKESITNENELSTVMNSLIETNHEIITIDYNQLNSFAGNIYQLFNKRGDSLIVMSEQAYKSFNKEQITKLEKYGRLVYSPLYTIEKYGGGSARCMIADIR